VFGIKFALFHIHGRDGSVGIEIRYGLDGPGIKSRCLRDFLCRPNQSTEPTSLQKNRYGVVPWGEAVAGWCWSHTSFYCYAANR